MMRALRMEWTKLRTDPGTRWCALALIAGTLAVSGLADMTTDALDCAPRPCTVDATRISLSGVYLGQIGAIVLAVLAVSREYESPIIRSTLAACPRRDRVLVAKAVVVLAAVAVTAVVALAATLFAARVLLPSRGLWLSLADEPTRRGYFGSVLYLCLVALLGLGVALIVRHTGAAIATTLGLLFVTPIAALFVTDPLWQARIRRYSPMTAGLTPWAGLRVLGVYAAAAVIVGAILFWRRDTVSEG